VIGLDTNVVLRWLLAHLIADAPDQIRQVEKAMAGRSDRLFINLVVVAETIWVLRNRVGQSRQSIKDIVDRLLNTAGVEIERRKAVEAAVASFAKGPGDFADHLIGQINRDAGCATTWTFDKAATKSPQFTQIGAKPPGR
jgi:predicted nucleic-acid-binding protein